MKKFFNNKIAQIGLMAFLVVAASILFYFIIHDLGDIIGIFNKILNILQPLIVGLVMAYIMHPIVNLFENKVFVKIKKKNLRRNLSITVTFVIIIAILATLISIIIPQLVSSVESLILNIPIYITNLSNWIKDWVTGTSIESAVLNNFDKISDSLVDMANTLLPATDSALSKISSGLVGVVTSIYNIAVGAVFAIYILANTKNFGAGMRKTLYSLFNVEKVNSFIEEVEHINYVFLHFMVGKICDSFGFVFTCTLVFLLIFRYPYPLLIAVIIGLTDLIPYFGPYIGSIPSALLIFLVSPVKALTFVLFIICLQQIDGNFVTPKIQKHVTGLPSFWVLFAITFFGGLFGIIGMLIGVPCFTIIYELVTDHINRRLKKKNLPTDSSYYDDIDGVQEKVVKSRLLSKKKAS